MAARAGKTTSSANDSALAARLRREITGDVLFDSFSRGRYATDASFYQIMPEGVVVPRSMDEALRALAIARDDGRIVTPRGGGTSQCGQTVNNGIVIDFSKHLNRIVSLDVANRTLDVAIDSEELASRKDGYAGSWPRAIAGVKDDDPVDVRARDAVED